MESGNKAPEHSAARTAWLLSLAGFIPFAILALAILIGGQANPLALSILDLFKIWSAIVLSFLGGIRWGLALSAADHERRELVLSVIPAIVGWLALLLPDRFGILVLLLAFSAHGAWDSFAVNAAKAPVWYGKLRITLTFLVAAAHIVVFIVLFNQV